MHRIIAIFILLSAPLYAETNIGKVVMSDGHVKRSNINCQNADCAGKGNLISSGERFRTPEDSTLNILLNDGTAVTIYGRSDVIISRVRSAERDKPTEIFIEKGKIRIIQKNSFMDVSLIVKTPVAVIKSVNSQLCIVSGSEETAIFLYSGEAGFAGLIPLKDDAYILTDGDESYVLRGESPSAPVKVERILRSSWLGRHFLSEDSSRVLRYRKESGPAEWPFIKND